MHECAYRVCLFVATVAAYITSKWNLLCTSQPRWYRHEKIAHGQNQSNRRLAGLQFFAGWSKLLFLQKFDGRVAELKLTDGGSNWQLTQCESLCFFWVALINNWWLHGRSEIQVLAEWLRGGGGHCQNYVISIGSLFSTALHGVAILYVVRLGSWWAVTKSIRCPARANQELLSFLTKTNSFSSNSFPLSFAIKVCGVHCGHLKRERERV